MAAIATKIGNYTHEAYAWTQGTIAGRAVTYVCQKTQAVGTWLHGATEKTIALGIKILGMGAHFLKSGSSSCFRFVTAHPIIILLGLGAIATVATAMIIRHRSYYN